MSIFQNGHNYHEGACYRCDLSREDAEKSPEPCARQKESFLPDHAIRAAQVWNDTVGTVGTPEHEEAAAASEVAKAFDHRMYHSPTRGLIEQHVPPIQNIPVKLGPRPPRRLGANAIAPAGFHAHISQMTYDQLRELKNWIEESMEHKK